MLIIGCGDVGQRLALTAKERGEDVKCLVRSIESLRHLEAQDLGGDLLDLDEPSPARRARIADPEIFYFAPPPSAGRTDPRMTRFLAALPPATRPRVVYISTTGVYGDCGGEWVDETRPVNPRVDRARRRYDAERQLADWRVAGGGELVILRVAGIYGPDKLPIKRLKKQLPMVSEDDAPWTNRLHIDDLVAVCSAAMARGRDGEVYNVSDGNPGNMRDYFDRVADMFNLPRAPRIAVADAAGTLSTGLLSYLAESRRLDNRKMLDELGVTLRYPTLEKGLAACRAASDGAAETGETSYTGRRRER